VTSVYLVETTVVEVLVACLFCDGPLDDPDDLWCLDCDDGDDAPERFAADATEDRPLPVAA